jgi:nitrite reductase/ring-hydroxylating ferredoxin subunit
MSERILGPNEDGCAGCSGRREFLRDATAIAATLLAGLGAQRADAQSLTLRVVRALWTSGSEVSYPVPPADGVEIDRDRELILVRWQGKAYAFALSCPHQRTMLRWREADQRFQCPKHRSRYEPDGTFISGRATRSMDRYPVKVESGSLVVDTTRVIRQDEDRPGWDAAFATV